MSLFAVRYHIGVQREFRCFMIFALKCILTDASSISKENTQLSLVLY